MDPNLPKVGELIEKGQQSAVNTTKAAVSDVSNIVSGQVGLKNETNTAQAQQNQAPVAEPSKALKEDLEATKEQVRDYYAPATTSTPTQAELMEQQRQEQLRQVRVQLAQELHNETYFNELLHAGETKPQAQVTEQEKMEEEKREDKMQDLQVQTKKDEDIAKFKAERRVEIVGGPVG